ncbi:MAG: A/G-specific adenine glycosylase [Alphaproteobacteria bacterium]
MAASLVLYVTVGIMQAARTPARTILDWYDRHHRRLPWRAAPGAKDARRAIPRPDPYKVWLSEIMLQQTSVATVGAYFMRFVERWPTVAALAAAPLDDVLHAWQGLGYYARARNLHKCAQAIAAERAGAFPTDEAELLRLPGIGRYTAAAIAAIAFDRPSVAIDGNIERVIARLFAVETPLPAAKAEIRARAAELVPQQRPGDYTQAVMDLGAMVCTPRAPKCMLCPWAGICRARARGIQEQLPRKAVKAARPVRHGVAFWIVNAKGEILVRRRPERGLLGGMMEFPSTPWRAERWPDSETDAHLPVALTGAPRWLDGQVTHVFTHFELRLRMLAASGAGRAPAGCRWIAPDKLHTLALPTVMKKLARLVEAAHAKAPPAARGRPKKERSPLHHDRSGDRV